MPSAVVEADDLVDTRQLIDRRSFDMEVAAVWTETVGRYVLSSSKIGEEAPEVEALPEELGNLP